LPFGDHLTWLICISMETASMSHLQALLIKQPCNTRRILAW